MQENGFLEFNKLLLLLLLLLLILLLVLLNSFLLHLPFYSDANSKALSIFFLNLQVFNVYFINYSF